MVGVVQDRRAQQRGAGGRGRREVADRSRIDDPPRSVRCLHAASTPRASRGVAATDIVPRHAVRLSARFLVSVYGPSLIRSALRSSPPAWRTRRPRAPVLHYFCPRMRTSRAVVAPGFSPPCCSLRSRQRAPGSKRMPANQAPSREEGASARREAGRGETRRRPQTFDVPFQAGMGARFSGHAFCKARP